MKRFALVALMLAASAPAAVSAGYDDLNVGISYLNLKQYDNAIVWLDKAIAAGDLIPDQLRVAELDRGLAYNGKEQPQKVLESLTAAIAAQPDDLTAYRLRISLYSSNGQFENELADYNTLNRLRPHDYATAMTIGRLNWYLDRTEASAAAFEVFSASDQEAWLWLQLTNMRRGKPVDDISKIFISDVWPEPVARFYAGRLTEAEMLNAAATSKSTLATCEGYFFAAMWRQVHDDQLHAKPLFEAAMKTCSEGRRYWIATLGKLDPAGQSQ